MHDNWYWCGLAEAMARLDPDFGRRAPPKRRITKRKSKGSKGVTAMQEFETLSYQEIIKIEGQLKTAKEAARKRELVKIEKEAKVIGLTLEDLMRGVKKGRRDE